MRRIAKVFVFLLVLICFSGAAAAQAVIGSVVRCAGTCMRVGDGVAESLTAGMELRLMQTLSTGAGSRLELRFADDTRLTLGEGAEVLLDGFVFVPGGVSRFGATASRAA